MTQTEMVFKNGNLSFVFVLFEEQTQQKTSFWCCFYLICCLFFSFLFCLQCRAVPAEYIWGKHWVLLFLQLQGRLSDVYPALTDLGQAAGMAASALNLNGLGVMNRSVLDFQFCTWFKLLKPHYHIWMCIKKNQTPSPVLSAAVISFTGSPALLVPPQQLDLVLLVAPRFLFQIGAPTLRYSVAASIPQPALR